MSKLTLLEVFEIVANEVKYAVDKWEDDLDRPVKDADKSVEFWIAHMENYLDSARRNCYGTDKTEALSELRKMAGLAVRCFQNLGVPERE